MMFNLSIPESWKSIPGRRHVCLDDDELGVMKRCNGCGVLKPEQDFAKTPTGLRSNCRVCTSIKTREWEKANRERRNAYQREYRTRAKA